MQIVPMRDLKNTVEIEKRCAESGEPVFVTKNGYGKLVVMDIALYEKLFAQNAILQAVNISVEEVKSGAKPVQAEVVFDQLEKKYEKK